MANNRDIKLDDYNISAYAYRELKYYCYQYCEKKRKVINGVENASADVYLIEQTAAEADYAIYPYLLQAVTTGKSYINLKMAQDIPCGKNYFNNRRRKFFYLLAKKRGLILPLDEKINNVTARLQDIIEDRKSFLCGDEESDKVFNDDIVALNLAIGMITLIKTIC